MNPFKPRACLLNVIIACFWAGAISGCSKPVVVGLHPDDPPVVKNRFSLVADFVEVDTLTPTFRWQPLTIAPADPSSHQVSARFENISYEIRIWQTVTSGTGKLVYARNQLTSTEHRLSRPLNPGTRYLWSVRAHFEVDGRHRITEWTLSGYLLRNETVPNDSCLRFKTPQEERIE